MAHRLVLDTNVLVAGLRSRQGASFRVLQLVDAGRATPVLSVPLVLEYEEVLKRQPSIVHLTSAEVDGLLDDLCTVGERHPIFYLWRPVLRDPRDELLLEVAIAAGCRDIVTHNVRDFSGSERFAVHIATPREWLATIGEGR